MKKYGVLTLLALLWSVSSDAQTPNVSHVPKKLFETGLFNLKTEEGQGAFTDAVVSTLHALDKRWGHLRKKPGQTQVHGHGEDSALYLSDEAGQSQAVDFIGGAGGPNPQPGWGVDQPRYSKSDWANPVEHGLGPPAVPPPPQYPGYPQPETLVDGAGDALFADFAQAGQAANPQMFRFAFRVAYSWLTKEVATLEASVVKHRKEWRELLGLP